MGLLNRKGGGKTKLGRRISETGRKVKENKNGYRKDLASDLAMNTVSAGITSTGLGAVVGNVTGKDFDDLVGYEQKTDVGRGIDKISDTAVGIRSAVAPQIAGMAATIATGNPQAGQAVSGAYTAGQDIYSSIDGRESDVDQDQMEAIGGVSQGVFNMANSSVGGMGGMKYGGKLSYADGGQLTNFDAGGTHEANPNGGIAQGPNANVEEGETKIKAKDYIFSDRIVAPKGLLQALKLDNKKYHKKTFADISKAIEKKYDPTGQRKEDSVVQSGIEQELNKLMEGQELYKGKMSQINEAFDAVEMAMGGKLNYAGGGDMEFSVNPMQVMNGANAAASMLGSQRMIRDLKKNKPTPKDLKMFDNNSKIRNPKIDYRSIFRANENAEGRARRSIGQNATDAGDILSSNIVLNQGTQKQNAEAYTKTQEAQAGIDMNVDQVRSNQEANNLTRSMALQDWNDKDMNVWLNTLAETRNQRTNNTMQSTINASRINQGEQIDNSGNWTFTKKKKDNSQELTNSQQAPNTIMPLQEAPNTTMPSEFANMSGTGLEGAPNTIMPNQTPQIYGSNSRDMPSEFANMFGTGLEGAPDTIMPSKFANGRSWTFTKKKKG